ncbi:hypothetical protein CSV80_13650 [Sporosarcina sp. P12(2017)]|uniref:CoA transferase n=1 Tax=unclassified Sporosarcina TaxID=2647733 RepID=UPI000C16E7F2|nr:MULTISPECIES: CoA transferase [unclassified Sporosarcina]PIC56713.1 hypothetical protein CSV81_13085 [Sporosarcina sp. P10]PIC59930.1 hypothetical protein CSV80_13650 [Sporosarcina sp. P12(2017)]
MPLDSIRVLDLSRLLPGPYCSMLLADFGAEVIKVEEPGIGDYARAELPKVGEVSALFHSLNRDKKSVCLYLKDEMNVKECEMLEGVKREVKSYMTYYTHHRGQWNLKKLPPAKYRQQRQHAA